MGSRIFTFNVRLTVVRAPSDVHLHSTPLVLTSEINSWPMTDLGTFLWAEPCFLLSWHILKKRLDRNQHVKNTFPTQSLCLCLSATKPMFPILLTLLLYYWPDTHTHTTLQFSLWIIVMRQCRLHYIWLPEISNSSMSCTILPYSVSYN